MPRPHTAITNETKRMPPKITAPRNHGHSARVKPEGCQRRSRISRAMVNPSPLPRYSRPANSSGGKSPTSDLASGVLAPNRAAARAWSMAIFMGVFIRGGDGALSPTVDHGTADRHSRRQCALGERLWMLVSVYVVGSRLCVFRGSGRTVLVPDAIPSLRYCCGFQAERG